MTLGCALCSVVESVSPAIVGSDAPPGVGELLAVVDGWPLLFLHDYAIPGWLVLCAPRHVESVGALDPAELANFATALGRLDRTLRTVTAAKRMYLVSFGERYAHWHCMLCAVAEDSAGAGLRGPALVQAHADLLDPARAGRVAAAVLRALDDDQTPRGG